MKKNPEVFLQHIIDSIGVIENYTKDFTQSSFLEYAQNKTQDAVVRRIEVIGEAVRNIPEDFRQQYSEIAWKKIAGMRNKLIHEYFGVDLELVWEVAKRDLPLLKQQILDLLKTISY